MKIFEYHQHEFGPRNVHCRISYSGHITFDPELHTLMSHIQPSLTFRTVQHLLMPQARKYSSSRLCIFCEFLAGSEDNNLELG